MTFTLRYFTFLSILLLLFSTIWECEGGMTIEKRKQKNDNHSLFSSFPIFNVIDFGAKGDGKTKDTISIQKTIFALSSAGGGILYFPKGTYVTSPINVTSNMIFFLDKDSIILGSSDLMEYPILPPLPSYSSEKAHGIPRYSSLLHGQHIRNFTLMGEGTIDGSGEYWWKAKVNATKPCLVEILNGEDLRFEGVTLKNSGFWTLHIWSSNNVVVEKITIMNPPQTPHTDGIDVDSSSNVLIQNVWISTANDHISIKSGSGEQGRNYGRPSQNVVVQSSYFVVGSGLAIGSETAGGIRNITFVNNTIALSTNYSAVRIKGCVNNGNTVEDIWYKNTRMIGGALPIFVEQYYECNPDNQTFPTTLRNINIVNMESEGSGQAGSFHCSSLNPCQINMENVHLDWNILGFTCNNVYGRTVNVTPKPCYQQ